MEPRDWISIDIFTQVNITEPPQFAGSQAYFECLAASELPITYTWFFESIDSNSLNLIDTSTSTNYQLIEGSLVLRDFLPKSRLFYCVVTNSLGSIRSRGAQYVFFRHLPIVSLEGGGLSQAVVNYLPCFRLKGERNNWKDWKMNTYNSAYNMLWSLGNYQWKINFSNDGEAMDIDELNSESMPINAGPALLLPPDSLEAGIDYICTFTWKPWYLMAPMTKKFTHSFSTEFVFAWQTQVAPKPIILGIFSMDNDFIHSTIQEGDRVSLNCIANQVERWKKDGISLAIPSDLPVSFSKGGRTLKFQNLTVNDIGKYQCIQKMGNETVISEVDLFVSRKSKVYTNYHEYVYISNATTHITLKCGFENEPNLKQITWLHNGEVISQKDIFAEKYTSLTINNSHQLLGVYQCISSIKNYSTVHDQFFSENIQARFEIKHVEIFIKSVTGKVFINWNYLGITTSTPALLTIQVYPNHIIEFVTCNVFQCAELNICPFQLLNIDQNEEVGKAYFNLKYNDGIHFNFSKVIIICKVKPGGDSDQEFSVNETILIETCENCNKDAISTKLNDIVTSTINSTTISEISEALHLATINVSQISESDINLSLYGIDRLILRENIYNSVNDNILSVFNNLLNVDILEGVTPENQFKFEHTANSYIQSLDSFTKSLSSFPDSPFVSLFKPRVSIAVVNISHPRFINEDLITYSLSDDHSTIDGKTDFSSASGISIRKESFDRTNPTASFIFMKSSMYFQIQDRKKSKIVSPVISSKAHIKNMTKSNLLSPILIWFGNLTVSANKSCVFWNEDLKIWSTFGCTTENVNTTFVRCHCNHLTNFALLLDVNGDTKISRFHQKILSTLSYTGIGISVFCLTLTTIIYISFLRKLFRKCNRYHQRVDKITPNLIILSFSVTLLLGNIAFLTADILSRNKIMCKIIGMLIHYLFLSVFLWTIVQSAHLYITVLKTAFMSNHISSSINHIYLKSSCFAWGLPLLVVGITITINQTDNYGHMESMESSCNQDIMCFLKTLPLYITFFAPIALIILINGIIFCLIVTVLLRHRISDCQTNPRRATFGLCGLVTILSLTWVFGLLQFGPVKLAFQYIFVLTTTLQGVFVFLFYCLAKPDVLCHISGILCVLSKADKLEDATSTTLTSKSKSTQIQSQISETASSHGNVEMPMVQNLNVH